MKKNDNSSVYDDPNPQVKLFFFHLETVLGHTNLIHLFLVTFDTWALFFFA